MPTYDDVRHVYDNPRLTYDGKYIADPLLGAQPSPTGQLTARVTYKRTLTGAQPSATATLTYRSVKLVQLSGAQPAGSGTAYPLHHYIETVTGDQPSGSGQLTQRATYRRLLTGEQPPSSGELTPRATFRRLVVGVQSPASGMLATLYIHRVLLTGFQPMLYSIHYDEPSITYDMAGIVYDEGGESGKLSWWVFRYRILEGLQSPPEGALGWKWNPYVWALYELSITDRPETTQYNFQLDADDYETTYDVDEADLHDDVVYHVRGIKVYTAPPPGVKQRT